MPALTSQEVSKLQAYLQRKFGNNKIALKPTKDSAELNLDGEFFGTVYKDTEDGETSFEITIAVLDIDLDEEKAA
jgi:hypothetical protein